MQVAIFQMADLFFDNILNLWTFCCTKLSELVRSPVVKVHDCSSSDPWFKLWDCKVLVCHPLGLPNLGERLGFNLVHKKCSPQIYKRGGVWVSQKSGGWVQSWVDGSCPKYPHPSYKRCLLWV